MTTNQINLNFDLNKVITDDTVLIVIAGSRISSSFHKKSDYDFFVITEKTNKVKMFKCDGVRIECFYYSKERLKNCVKANDHIIVDVLSIGQVLYKCNNKEAEEIISWMKSLYNFYQIEPAILLKFQYRFEMIKEKLEATEDEMVIRWLNSFSLPYILRFLFYFNHHVGPTTKKWPSEVLKLKRLPDNFEKIFKAMLGEEFVEAKTLKQIILNVLEYIQSHIGNTPDFFEIRLTDNDLTTLI